MKSKKFIAPVLGATLAAQQASARSAPPAPLPETLTPKYVTDTSAEPVAPGRFSPTWDSLAQYRVPQWYSQAKFGIWAIYGPQCQPERGDWFARGMYLEGTSQYKWHEEHFGPPSQDGFKDVIHRWKADKWDPDALVRLYQRAGAQYVFVMANHHDNFDLYDSKHQPWNSVKLGPRRDIVGDIANAARAHGLPFGVSVHAAHAWIFYEPAQGADQHGPRAGVRYDGALTKADGKGTWWDGLDPQDLYEQRHIPSAGFLNPASIHSQWDYQHGASIPDEAYCQRFYNRTMDLINTYKPDLVYWDDDVLPLWPVSDAGLKIAANFYNRNMAQHGGDLRAVMTGKQLSPRQLQCMVWDIERGSSNQIEPATFQTDTCIGDWHYSRPLYDRNGYKSAPTVIRALADIVSKNGNLLLNIPVRGDGSLDEKETAILADIATWMDANKECIFGTHPWKVLGEGPALDGPQSSAVQMNENKVKPLTAEDVRFTAKDDAVYAIILGRPGPQLTIKSLGTAAALLGKPIKSVTLLGSDEKVEWTQSAEGLHVTGLKKTSDAATVLKVGT
jgi:alpha-L-fucosidase